MCDTHTSCLPVWHTFIVWHTHVSFIRVTHTRLVDMCDTHDTHASRLQVWHTHVSHNVWHTHVWFICVTHTRLENCVTRTCSFICVTHACHVYVCETHMMSRTMRTHSCMSRLHVWDTHISSIVCNTLVRLHVWHTQFLYNVRFTHPTLSCVTHTCLV